MRISLQLVIAVMAIFGLMGVAAAASPDDSTGPKTPPSSPPELGTGSRPSSNNANRPSRNKGEPVVKSLEDEVYEALGACLKGWFNVSHLRRPASLELEGGTVLPRSAGDASQALKSTIHYSNVLRDGTNALIPWTFRYFRAGCGAKASAGRSISSSVERSLWKLDIT